MGEEFRLRTDEDPVFLQKLSEYVNSKIEDVKENTDIVDSFRVILMASLSMAEEYFNARGELEKIKETIELKSDELAKKMQEC